MNLSNPISILNREPVKVFAEGIDYLDYSFETRTLYVQIGESGYNIFSIPTSLWVLLVSAPSYPKNKTNLSKKDILLTLVEVFPSENTGGKFII